MRINTKHLTFLLAAAAALAGAIFSTTACNSGAEASPRTVTLLDEGWNFHKGEEGQWEKVTIPHDWAIYGPFDRSNDLQEVAIVQNFEKTASVKTGRTGGLPYVGVGWYKRTFDVDLSGTPEDGAERRATLLFDGAMSEARVYVNGQEVIFWPYGYNAFHCDITPYLTQDGKNNELKVRLENRPQSSRWYPGAGLYRNVYLIETDRIHVPVWGTRILTEVAEDFSAAQVKIETKLDGVIKGDIVKISTDILDSNGNVVASSEDHSIVGYDEAGQRLTVEQVIPLNQPSLWSPESPALYKAVSKIYAETETPDSQRLADVYTTTFGVRSIEIRPESGFYLNGQNRKFQGVCLHHDLGPLGAAINESAIRHQLTLLKDMGCDAVRTTHNMPAPELIRLCDEMGFMVMVENFDEWDVAKCDNGYHRFFEDWAEKDMINMLHQFRNNPSVVMWSIGNEVPTQWKPEGYEVATFLQDICHREDPTRPVTCGMDQVDAILSNGFGAVLDVPGFNYRTHRYTEGYGKLPQKILLGSETSSTVSSRGVYKFPIVKRADALYEDHHSSSYDLEHCSWSNIPDEDLALAQDYPWTMGQFVWTGFDYLGEPSPYDTDAWPNHSSMFGIIDLASIPKDRYWLYRSQWNEDSPTLHILPHWNWEGREGETTPVFVYTSYPKAELFLNGKSLGVREKLTAAEKVNPSGKPKDYPGDITESPLLQRYRLMWGDVRYEPGELKVVAYDEAGNPAAEKIVRTAGEPAAIELVPTRKALTANGKDLMYVTVRIVDKDGNLCPTDSRKVQFEVSGAGCFRAVANGDPTCLELFHEPQMSAFGGMLTAIVQSGKKPGTITLTASTDGLESSTLNFKSEQAEK